MKRMGAAAVLAAALLLSGCGKAALPYAREMGDMALLRTMGVDAEEEAGQVRVTVSTGKRAAGLQGESQPPLILSAGGESLSAACLSMQGLSDSYVFYGYVDQLLLGEEAALEGVEPVLDYFSRDVELGLGAQVWLVRGGTAQAAIQAGGETGVDSRLSTLQTDSEMGAAGITRTAGEIYTDLLERGTAFLPALALGEEGTALREQGYAVLDETGLLGYLDGEAARGLELLTGRAPAQILTMGQGEDQISARPLGVFLRPKLVLRSGEFAGLALDCRIDVELTEYRRMPKASELEALQQELAHRFLGQLEETLEQLQRWGADCAGLGPRAGGTHPNIWRQIEGAWPTIFAEMDLQTEVRVAIHQ